MVVPEYRTSSPPSGALDPLALNNYARPSAHHERDPEDSDEEFQNAHRLQRQQMLQNSRINYGDPTNISLGNNLINAQGIPVALGHNAAGATAHHDAQIANEQGLLGTQIGITATSAGAGTNASSASSESVPHIRCNDKTPFFLKYEIGVQLGRGAFGTVRLVTNISTREVFACKIILKRAKGSAPMSQIEREVEIMKSVRQKHVVQIHEVYETPKKLYIVMEYCNGGELVKRVQMTHAIEEKDIKLVIKRLATVVGFMHDRGIVHRDIKPENILLSTQDPSDPYNIKVSDFGLATFTSGGKLMENVCGTPLYMAPEVVQGLGYTHSCDIWSIGIMMGLLLAKYTQKAENDLREMAANGQIIVSHPMWKDCDSLGKKAKGLLERMLQTDPAKRISAKEIANHSWITGDHNEREKEEPHTVLDMMKRYRAEQRWKKAVYAVIAFNRFLRMMPHKQGAGGSHQFLSSAVSSISASVVAGGASQYANHVYGAKTPGTQSSTTAHFNQSANSVAASPYSTSGRALMKSTTSKRQTQQSSQSSGATTAKRASSPRGTRSSISLESVTSVVVASSSLVAGAAVPSAQSNSTRLAVDSHGSASPSSWSTTSGASHIQATSSSLLFSRKNESTNASGGSSIIYPGSSNNNAGNSVCNTCRTNSGGKGKADMTSLEANGHASSSPRPQCSTDCLQDNNRVSSPMRESEASLNKRPKSRTASAKRPSIANAISAALPQGLIRSKGASNNVGEKSPFASSLRQQKTHKMPDEVQQPVSSRLSFSSTGGQSSEPSTSHRASAVTVSVLGQRTQLSGNGGGANGHVTGTSSADLQGGVRCKKTFNSKE